MRHEFGIRAGIAVEFYRDIFQSGPAVDGWRRRCANMASCSQRCRLGTATYSVLIDRIVGVFALALIVIACLPWTFELIHDPTARTVLLMIGLWCGRGCGRSSS